jgi:hypothetical protein
MGWAAVCFSRAAVSSTPWDFVRNYVSFSIYIFFDIYKTKNAVNLILSKAVWGCSEGFFP